jgi:hypothetical protein
MSNIIRKNSAPGILHMAYDNRHWAFGNQRSSRQGGLKKKNPMYKHRVLNQKSTA